MPIMGPPLRLPQDKDKVNNADGIGKRMNLPAIIGAEDRAKDGNPMHLTLVFPPKTTMPWTQAPPSAKPFLTKKRRNTTHKADVTNAASRGTSHVTARSVKTAKDKPEYDPRELQSPKKVLIQSSLRKPPPKLLNHGHSQPALLG